MGYASAAGPRPKLIALGLQILGIAASGSWLFWYANLLFGMIGGFTLASWGPWAEFGTLGSITKDTVRSRPGFLLIFGGFWCPWVSFGMLPFSTLASSGTLGRSWDDPGHWGIQERTLRCPGLDFY